MADPTIPMKDILDRKHLIDKALSEAGIPYDALTCIAIVLMGRGLEERGFVVKQVHGGPASTLIH